MGDKVAYLWRKRQMEEGVGVLKEQLVSGEDVLSSHPHQQTK